MENLTHSLLGATLAELALPADATPAQRRLFFTVGVIAANLPDADLLYTRITPPPIGYLLHHRGHTHTLVGLIAQAALVGAICMLPALKSRIGNATPRLWALIGLGLLSHVFADSWNSYGVHPFWPFDSRWYFGDSIFIAEPWLWILLGIAAALNAHRPRARLILGVLLATLVVGVTATHAISLASGAALLVGGAVLTIGLLKVEARRRSAIALALAGAFVATMFTLRRVVEHRVVASATLAPGDEVIDVILNPQPASPLCWTGMSIVKNEQADRYVMTGLNARLAPIAGCGMPAGTSVEWRNASTQALGALRALDRDDCHVSAWLQFGRAPLVSEGSISDIRFGGVPRGNFSTMPLRPAGAACPPNLTNWGKPRADVL